VSAARVPYAGLATRAVALVIDVALAQLVVSAAFAMLGLVASLVGELRPTWLVSLIVGVGWAVTVGAYLVLFWSLTGQTPGMRCMGVRVEARDGRPPSIPRALVRLLGLVLAIIPLFLGFLPVLVDDRRRGIHDMLARTVVLYDRDEPEQAPVLAAAHPGGMTT
jgi:uncharacterized RDD family membrane protein YckC